MIVTSRIVALGQKLVLALMLCLTACVALAQSEVPDLKDKSFREIKQMAKHALRLGDTYTALFYYDEWSRRKNDDVRVAYQVAELYRLTRNYVVAEDRYAQIAKDHEEMYPLSWYHLGMMQMANEKYEQAKESFAKFKKVTKLVKDPSYRKLYKVALEGCDFAVEQQAADNNTVITHLDTSINHAHIEYSPIYLADSLMLYGSLLDRRLNYYSINVEDSTPMPDRKVYAARRNDGKWKSLGEYEEVFNRPGMDFGNATLSTNGKRLYFTWCKKNWQNKTVCELHYSDLEDNGWSEPVRMGDDINLDGYTTTQPAVGRESKKNEEVIYFVSDRPGGKGGLDIWYTQYNKRKKTYRTPKNCGSKINTAGSEMTPFYDQSTHKIYFSTDGLPGWGGLDVFSASGERSKFTLPENMMKDINSSADDLDFEFHRDHKEGFVVSNRKGGVTLLNETCCDDIYQFKLKEYIDIKLIGEVNDSTECLDNVRLNVYIIDEETEEKYLTREETVDCEFELNLDQGFDYNVEVVKEGYFASSSKVSTKATTSSVVIERPFHLEKMPEPDKPIVLEGILYDFNSANLTESAKTCIDTGLYEIMKQNPALVIKIGSHTDSKGSDAYNQKLSHDRAASVVKYLTKVKGIHEDRLEYEGYGEALPIAPNQNEDGSDNPAGRALNRRTEFSIVRSLTEDELYDMKEIELGED